MNVLMLAESSACNVNGGSHRMIREQAIALTRRGHSVRIMARQLADDPSLQSSFAGITEYRYPVNKSSAPAFVLSSITGSTKTFDQILSTGFTPDVILIDQSLAGFGPVIFRRHVCPVWVYQSFSLAHEEYVTRNTPGSGILNRINYLLHVQARFWIERWTINRTDRVIIMSDFMKKQLVASHHTPDSRIHLLPGAADTDRFRPPSNKAQARADINLHDNRTFLFTVRNLVPRMGLENLIRAVAKLGNACDNTLLIIGGTGPLRQPLEQLVTSLKLNDRITFAGFIPDTRLPAYYQAADLVIMPTLTLEGFGMVTVEALACGTPVLGTPVGATPEILAPIDKRLITRNHDANAIAESLAQLLQIIRNAPGDWHNVANSCIRSVEQLYNWNKHGEQLESILLAACRA